MKINNKKVNKKIRKTKKHIRKNKNIYGIAVVIGIMSGCLSYILFDRD